MNTVLKHPAQTLIHALVHMLVGVIHIYRYAFSSIMPGHCRYTPTCSAYAIQALKAHGILQGSWLAVKRICRCHPWGACGHDPVPGMDH